MAIGHNNPPSILEVINETAEELEKWLEETPVIGGDEEARQAKLYFDRASDNLKSAELERKSKVEPLNRQLSEINALYKIGVDPLFRIRKLLEKRLTDFAERRRAEREQAAMAAIRAAEAAKQKAIEAEAREKEALEEASQGVIDSGAVAATKEANQAFQEYVKAETAAARAGRETHVKIAGGFRRAFSIRKTKTLVLTNWKDAIEHMGVTDKIRDSILSSARDFRHAFDDLPHGVEEEIKE